MVSKLGNFWKFREILIFSTAPGEVATDFVSHCNAAHVEANVHQNQYFPFGISLGSSSIQTPPRKKSVFEKFISSPSSDSILTDRLDFQGSRIWKIGFVVLRMVTELFFEEKSNQTKFILGGVCLEEDPSEIPEEKYWF